VSFTVAPTGHPDTTSIVFHGQVTAPWQAEVRRSLRRTLFRPALVDGCPVSRRVDITFEF
jgi:hypothetical protein